MTANQLRKKLQQLASPMLAEHAKRFFKTGKGEYGEGDVFLGIRVPVLRKLAKEFKDLHHTNTVINLKSKFHEERLCALFILTHQFERGNNKERAAIYKHYLAHTKYINNWDLVDATAHKIVGPYLFERSRAPLYKLSRSKSLWERRIAIIATYHFIKHKHFDDTLELSKRLLTDEEDLMHKAVGWMLREVGKHKIEVEKKFLKVHYKKMPRTMLRYAIEKFPEKERKRYLNGSV